MEYSIKAIVSALILAAFGLFLIWKGISGDVAKTINGKEIIPKWIYTLGGIVVLILPVAYLIVLLQIK